MCGGEWRGRKTEERERERGEDGKENGVTSYAKYKLTSNSTILNMPANYSPKDESSNNHDPVFIDDSSQSKDKLTNTDESAKNNCANPNAKYSV